MTNAISVKARLNNLSKQEGKTMQDNLVSYAMERSIYRLSISKYSEHFVLKGGIFLYAIFGRAFPRATVDIDLLGRKVQNNPEKITEIFKEVFSINADDALTYDMNSMVVKNITEFKKYHGVNVYITAHLDRTRIPVSIDIGFGDVIYPDSIEMDFPVLLNMDAPKVYAYSIYSVIAEKFEAIVSLGLANSRYKDFYDIYQIAKHFNLDGKELKEAIIETFEHRGTGFDDIIAFEPGFSDDTVRIRRWRAFTEKKKAIERLDFSVVVSRLKDFLQPIVVSIREGDVFKLDWNHETGYWDKL
ncbi:MAG: nucleotidyl transferase AbiEii/AbiGii toxin family protein [Lachnospiraceae bacterium]|nr:nucleotidyl transferase AbiEii/AbiGii toxin family protein [Lachnospiraceae bacterium]MDO4939645.1 nucleotidyl transferase AbiEii/AbiGii toxin family protein [Lachnospiraceae bacterium]